MLGFFFKMYGFIDYVLLFCVFPVFLYYSYNADEDQKWDVLETYLEPTHTNKHN